MVCGWTICVDGLKSAAAKPLITSKMVAAVSVVVSLLPTMHFSVACVARGLTLTEPTTPASIFEGGSGLGMCRNGGMWRLVAVRVRSHLLSKTLLTVTICFKFGGSRGSNEVRSLSFFEHCASPTADVLVEPL